MASTQADDAILQTLAHFGLSSFSTLQFIERYRSLYPAKWKEFEDAFGVGGKGSGRYYSSFSLISQTLQRMHVAGNLRKLDYRPAPAGWGSPIIRYWTLGASETGGTLYPDQPDGNFEEGTMTHVLVNKYERNLKARQKCIEHYGLTCMACDMDFEERYGPRGAGFIHVHHLKPISEIKEQYVIDPVADLRPVCPNCHAMIHYRSPVLSIDQLRAELAKNSN